MDMAITPALRIDAIPLLARLSKDRAQTLERHTTIRIFAAGERVFDEGEENPGRLYVVLDGEVSLCNRGKAFSTHTMDDYEIAAHGRHAVFGAISFLDGKSYSSSAYAKTALTLAIFDFSAALSENGPVQITNARYHCPGWRPAASDGKGGGKPFRDWEGCRFGGSGKRG